VPGDWVNLRVRPPAGDRPVWTDAFQLLGWVADPPVNGQESATVRECLAVRDGPDQRPRMLQDVQDADRPDRVTQVVVVRSP
jgi:hypothetical protein